jgi:hypothetical protein
MSKSDKAPYRARIEKPSISEEEKLRRLENSAQNTKWLLDNEDELLMKYLHKYIAIKNQKVVFVADTPEEMATKTQAAGEDLNDLLCGYMDKGPRCVSC